MSRKEILTKDPLLRYCNNILIPSNAKQHVEHFKIILPWDFWKIYYDSNRNRLKRGWTDYLNRYFETVNKFCNLAFKYHTISIDSSRSSNVFHSLARCTHSSCAVYHFKIHEKLVENKCITMHIIQIGKFHQTNEIRRRFIRGEFRKELAMLLEKSPPSVVKFKMAGQIFRGCSYSR